MPRFVKDVSFVLRAYCHRNYFYFLENKIYINRKSEVLFQKKELNSISKQIVNKLIFSILNILYSAF